MSDAVASLESKRRRLLDLLTSYERCVVAYSGGVDSAVVAQAAYLALGERALAVTGVSASLAAGELDEARRVAAIIGIRHEVIPTDELANPAYLQNDPQRCYHCKTELYTRLEGLAVRYPGTVIVNGANADDRGDHRPGMQAAREHRVASPLLDCELTKEDVRALAADWNLPVWDKPATPCLSSRIAYGEEVTPQRLALIDAAENWLRAQGLGELRVRYHGGDLARIEVSPGALERLAAEPLRSRLVTELARLGFRFVTLDLAGFRSGSLNTLVPAESLRVLS